MKTIRIISRFILGFVFIFSGFVKAIDPLGSAYKIADYFTAFNMGFFDSLSLPIGVFLAAFELVLGVVLILGYQKRLVYWVLLIFMSFFTILTFFLGVFNPVSDCGCFGDAIIMTNWQTFFKNIILMVFVLVVFYSRKRAKNIMKGSYEKALILLFFAGSFLLSISCLKQLPVIDFRPYHVGTYIQGGMEIPEDAPMDVYNTTLVYRNLESGDTEEFTLENYPKDTLQWGFVTSESKLVSKGYEAPIHDFGLSDDYGYDITDDLLADEDYSLMMVSHDIDKANEEALIAMNDWYNLKNISGDFNFIPVTASGTSMKDEVSQELGLDYAFYSADEIMLKTVVRSNPGFVLLKNGTIIAKWSHQNFPDMSIWDEEWKELTEQFVSEQDPEILMLIDEGFMEEIQWDVVDFDKTANQVVARKNVSSKEKLAWISFFISVIFIFVVLQLPVVNRSMKRG